MNVLGARDQLESTLNAAKEDGWSIISNGSTPVLPCVMINLPGQIIYGRTFTDAHVEQELTILVADAQRTEAIKQLYAGLDWVHGAVGPSIQSVSEATSVQVGQSPALSLSIVYNLEDVPK